MKIRAFASSIWEYASEIVLSAILLGLIMFTFPSSDITTFMDKTAREFNSLVLVLFSASLAVWITFVNITGSEFGGYLHFKRCLHIYNWAFLSAVGIYFLSSISLILTIGIGNAVSEYIAIFFLLYGLLNLITMIRNSTGLIRLYSEFREEVRKIEASTKGTNGR